MSKIKDIKIGKSSRNQEVINAIICSGESDIDKDRRILSVGDRKYHFVVDGVGSIYELTRLKDCVEPITEYSTIQAIQKNNNRLSHNIDYEYNVVLDEFFKVEERDFFDAESLSYTPNIDEVEVARLEVDEVLVGEDARSFFARCADVEAIFEGGYIIVDDMFKYRYTRDGKSRAVRYIKRVPYDYLKSEHVSSMLNMANTVYEQKEVTFLSELEYEPYCTTAYFGKAIYNALDRREEFSNLGGSQVRVMIDKHIKTIIDYYKDNGKHDPRYDFIYKHLDISMDAKRVLNDFLYFIGKEVDTPEILVSHLVGVVASSVSGTLTLEDLLNSISSYILERGELDEIPF